MANDFPLYDFSSAGSVPRTLANGVNEWFDKFAAMFAERWSDFSVTEISTSKLNVAAKSFAQVQQSWNVPCFGMPITIEANSMTAFLAIQRADLLALLLDILGGGTPDDAADRELTAVEESLCKLLLDHSVSVLGEAWPKKDPLTLTGSEIDTNSSRSRLFEGDEEMIIAGVSVTTSIGSSMIQVLFPKTALESLLEVESGPASTPNGPAQVPINNLAEVSVTVSALLGSTMMDMADLSSIAEGDIVMLDQQIVAPIVLSVNDQPMFQAWPGRVGTKQGLQVDSFVNQ